MTGWRIVCDAGGTNLRCARSHGPLQLSDAQVIASEEAVEIADVLMSYASRFPDAENLKAQPSQRPVPSRTAVSV